MSEGSTAATSDAEGHPRVSVHHVLIGIGLMLVVLGGFTAHEIQTVGGSVRVESVHFPSADGKRLSALLYTPDGVDATHKAPGILAVHGYINSRETQSGFAIEFARRGYVVLALDQSGHGFSRPPAFANGFGGPDALAYLRALDTVDPDNIGLEGHSMGGWAVLAAAAAQPDGYKAMVLEGSAPGSFGAPQGTQTFPRNLAVVFSAYDEFSDLMWGVPTGAEVVRVAEAERDFRHARTGGAGETVRLSRVRLRADAARPAGHAPGRSPLDRRDRRGGRLVRADVERRHAATGAPPDLVLEGTDHPRRARRHGHHHHRARPDDAAMARGEVPDRAASGDCRLAGQASARR